MNAVNGCEKSLPFRLRRAGGLVVIVTGKAWRRLSIDVDIACTVSGNELKIVLRKIGTTIQMENDLFDGVFGKTIRTLTLAQV